MRRCEGAEFALATEIFFDGEKRGLGGQLVSGAEQREHAGLRRGSGFA